MPYQVRGNVTVESLPAKRRVVVLSESDLSLLAEGISAADGSFTLGIAEQSDPVTVLVTDKYGSKLAADTLYSLGDRVHPVTPNGFYYECTTSGTSSDADNLPIEPWSTETDLTTGTAVFTPSALMEPVIHSPVIPEPTP